MKNVYVITATFMFDPNEHTSLEALQALSHLQLGKYGNGLPNTEFTIQDLRLTVPVDDINPSVPADLSDSEYARTSINPDDVETNVWGDPVSAGSPVSEALEPVTPSSYDDDSDVPY